MEDFLKNKLSEYKPTFKEAYWTEMSAKLNKKRRRKRLIFLILSGTSAIVVISSIWSIIYFNQNQTPAASSQEIAMNQQPASNSAEGKKLPQLDNEKSTTVPMESAPTASQTASSLNKPADQQSNKSSSSLNEKAQTLVYSEENKTASTKNDPIEGLQQRSEAPALSMLHQSSLNNSVNPVDTEITTTTTTTTTSTSTSKAVADILAEDELTSNHESKSNIEKNLSGLLAHEESNNRSANWQHKAGDDKQNIPDFIAIAVRPLEYPSIALFDRQILLPSMSPLQQVKINVTRLDNLFMATAFQIGAGLVSNSTDDLIYEQHIQLKRYMKFDNSMLYTAIGLAAGRYQGTFQAIDNEQVSYRTFAENSISQSLIPKDLYYLSLPLEFGITLGKLNAGINISPEYLLAVHGNVVTREQTNTVASAQIIEEPLNFSVNQNTSTQKKSTWLDEKNIKTFNYSFGIIAGYRAGKHWHISLSGNYYPNGLYSFKHTIRSSNSITGRKNNLKGGLHVAYIF